MKISDLTFGSEDARYIDTSSVSGEGEFLNSFVFPRGFKIDDFLSGNRYFVYGVKGAGKSALLKYIEVIARTKIGATTDSYYFQSTFSQQKLNLFRKRLRDAYGTDDALIDDTLFREEDEIKIFWKVFLLTAIKKLLQKANCQGQSYDKFCKSLEIVKAISRAEQVKRKLPALRTFQARLSRDPLIQLDGDFADATINDFETYLEYSMERLEEISMSESPVFLFVDEMEVYRSDDDTHRIEILAISALIQQIRDLNEQLRENGIFIVAAVRGEIVSLVSEVLYELHRLVRAKGIEVSWQYPNISGEFHPLFKTILNRIVARDPEFRDYELPISEQVLTQAFQKYFIDSTHSFELPKRILDLTWYRPRDLAMLFEEAQLIQGDDEIFNTQTITYRVVPKLGERMWQDAVSGLAAKYSKDELKAIDCIFRGGEVRYTKLEFIDRIEKLSDMYDEVALFSESSKLIDVVEDLYRVGVVSMVTGPEHSQLNFYFRGDPMPSLSDKFLIEVHKTLRRTLSISASW